MKRSPPNRRGKPTISKLKKKLDKTFSLFIRQRDNFTCFTCGNSKQTGKMIHAGHFASRQFNATRYDEKNVHAQCYACNMFYNGRPHEYAVKLQEVYGDGIIKELRDKAREIKQWSVPELLDLIAIYKEKIKELALRQ